MTAAARHRLPSRRPSVTVTVVWQTEGAEFPFFVTMGFDPADNRLREVFYADGQKSGAQLQASIIDACILISRLLQYGDTPEAILRGMSTVPLWGGEEKPASVVGAVVAAVVEELER